MLFRSRATETKELAEECSAARLEFHDRYWKHVSEEAKDFIKHLIRPEPTERPTATEALRHKVRTLQTTRRGPVLIRIPFHPKPQWLTDHEPSVEHDLSTGLRDNWSVLPRSSPP